MTAVALEPEASRWADICDLDQIVPWTGVCALVGARQVAIVRTADAVYAIGNFDPFSKAFVLSRGIVGDKGGVPKIASPIFKQTLRPAHRTVSGQPEDSRPHLRGPHRARAGPRAP